MMESISELQLQISPESVEMYTQVAQKHLNEHSASLDVSCAGVDETGTEVFGICMRSSDGQEEWYVPDGDDESIMGWDEQDAHFVLNHKVLPNLGYAVFQRDLQLFHMNMRND